MRKIVAWSALIGGVVGLYLMLVVVFGAWFDGAAVRTIGIPSDPDSWTLWSLINVVANGLGISGGVAAFSRPKVAASIILLGGVIGLTNDFFFFISLSSISFIVLIIAGIVAFVARPDRNNRTEWSGVGRKVPWAALAIWALFFVYSVLLFPPWSDMGAADVPTITRDNTTMIVRPNR